MKAWLEQKKKKKIGMEYNLASDHSVLQIYQYFVVRF